jgi:hypothetical protein
VTAFVVADDGAGIRTKAAALPVRLREGAIDAIEHPALNVHDRVALETAMLL